MITISSSDPVTEQAFCVEVFCTLPFALPDAPLPPVEQPALANAAPPAIAAAAHTPRHVNARRVIIFFSLDFLDSINSTLSLDREPFCNTFTPYFSR